MTRFGKTLAALAAVATLAIGTMAAPQQAEARGGRVAAGIIGGIAAGAIIGGLATNGYGYGSPAYGYGRPQYGYAPSYAYGPPRGYYGPRCWWSRERVWDGYGWRMHRVRVCN